MTSLVELSVVTIVPYGQMQNSAFIVVLEDKEGIRRLPVIIGNSEAQSILLAIEKDTPPRPLTHDLFVDFMKATHSVLQHVLIYKFSEGIFYSRLNFLNEKRAHFSVEARTSDSIAIALRCDATIYTTAEVMSAAGIPISELTDDDADSPGNISEGEEIELENDFAETTDDELAILLEEAIENEDYEKATLIRDEIRQRKEIKGE